MTNNLPEQSLLTGTTHQHFVQAGDGPLLLLIHGSLCDYRYWRWQMPALAKGYRVLAPSLRGYWPQALDREDPDFGVDQQVNDLIALVRHLSPNAPAHVLGHSRGAQIAVELALQFPEHVASLILADPGFRMSDEPETPALHDGPLQALRNGDIEAGLAAFVNAVNGQDIWKHMVGWFKAMVQDNAYTLLSQAREVNRSVDIDALAQLDCPTLLINGSNSPPRYTSRSDRLAERLPHAQRSIIPLASHGMNLANPKAFNQAVLAFLAQHSLPAKAY